MKVTALQCKECFDTIYSRARHDMRWCSCKSSAIDGGQTDYIKITGQNYELTEINVPKINLRDLYDDWSTSKDKYGLIKRKKSE